MLYVAIVLGIVLGSSLGYHMPISLLIAKIFRERRSLAFGIFRIGPGLSGVIVPIIGGMIVWWGWRTAAMTFAAMLLSSVCRSLTPSIRIAQREETEQEMASAATPAWRRDRRMVLRTRSSLSRKCCVCRRFGFFRSPWRCDTW